MRTWRLHDSRLVDSLESICQDIGTHQEDGGKALGGPIYIFYLCVCVGTMTQGMQRTLL